MAKNSKEATRDLENFEDIMELTAEDVREPELYPEGPWVIRNVGFTLSDVTNKDGDEQKLINLRYEGFEAGPEVDPDAIEQGGYEGRTLWVKRYISKPAAKAAKDGSLSRFVKFAALHGIETSGKNLTELCKSLKGATVAAQIGTRSYENRDGDTIHDNTVSSVSAIEE